MTEPRSDQPASEDNTAGHTKSSSDLPLAPVPPAPEPPEQQTPTDSDPLAQWRAAREMEEEMSDIFNEDRVTHRHGGSEPEAD